ncbi:MAG TPA: protease modulator HflC, partial [Wenzhouxiangellaceae bacterium]|nr:protease modulator HflC [Wenzhouxiangellaceae bacterium]
MKPALIAILAVLAIAAGNFIFYTVDEAEQAIIVQFGEPIGDVISEPGLKVKLPWQQVRYFDKRLLVWDGDVTQIPTLGREFILVDTTARWRIADPLLFLTSVRDEAGARTRLDDIVDSVVRDMVSSTELEEIVRSKDWSVDVEELDDPALAERDDVNLEMQPSLGRELLEEEILARAQRSMPQLGIELDDVRIKRVNYIDSVRKQVESRMIAERQSIAERFRSEGMGRSQEILGNMERDLRRIRSEAAREAEEIRGNADAEATRIYGVAYGEDPEFYSFFRT